MKEKHLRAYAFLILVALSMVTVVLVYFGGYVGLDVGFIISGLLALLASSIVSVPFELGAGTPTNLYDLGMALRLRGARVIETGDGIRIPVGALYSVEVFSVKRGTGVETRYKIGWTSTGLFLMILLLVTVVGNLVTVVISIYALLKVQASFDGVMQKAGEREISRRVERRDDIGHMLIFSLAEANRIAWDVRTVRHSRYQDVILLSVFFIGLVGSLVLYIIFSGLGGAGPHYGPLELVSAISISVGLTIVACLLARWKMSPNIKKADSWVMRLEMAMAREEAGISADGESTVGLLIEVGAVLPEWLQVRERGQLDNNAVMWIVAFFLIWPAAYGFANGISLLLTNSGDSRFGLLMIAVSLALTFAAYLIYRYLLKQERVKSNQIRREWEWRQQYLTRRLEELIEGM
ncbi:MAG: hypothetical protein LUO79_08640 [Methanomassiliicoccales archaeon]|nr:hypothetical protein [Methanomassiliicoccales archaeon]